MGVRKQMDAHKCSLFSRGVASRCTCDHRYDLPPTTEAGTGLHRRGGSLQSKKYWSISASRRKHWYFQTGARFKRAHDIRREMQDRGGFLPSNNTHFTGTGLKEAPTRHAERVSKQLSGAPWAELTHRRDRLLAGSGGRNLGFAFSGGNRDESVSAHSRLRMQGWSQLPLPPQNTSLPFTVPRSGHVCFVPLMLHVFWGKNCPMQRCLSPPPVQNDNPSAVVISSVIGGANKKIFPETHPGYQLARLPSSLCRTASFMAIFSGYSGQWMCFLPCN